MRGANCVIVEDVVTTGGSVLETAEALRKAGLVVDTAVVVLNREQGGRENLQQHGITLISMLSVHQVLASLKHQGLITENVMQLSTDFINNTRPDLPTSTVRYQQCNPQNTALLSHFYSVSHCLCEKHPRIIH